MRPLICPQVVRGRSRQHAVRDVVSLDESPRAYRQHLLVGWAIVATSTAFAAALTLLRG